MVATVSVPRLEARSVTVRYGTRAALDRVSVCVRQGEVLFVMGPSGCGKTTLLKCLAGLIRPTEGDVLFEGRPLEAEGGPTLDALRRATGFVFQGGALLSSISLSDNLALPMRVRFALPPPVVDEAVRMKLAQVGLLDAAHLMPSELSGGMRKRAGIARALAIDPNLLLLDEPTSGLDPTTADEIDTLIGRLREDLGATVVVVSHDLASAAKLADRIVIIVSGSKVVEGTWQEVHACRECAVRDFLERRGRPTPEAHGAQWEKT
jgi:phospholipid/cholesterol/gamma-HCH transport system ATP-binding protein